ncbi:asparagine synthase-related protein [Streptomyces flavidovirens]
MAASTWVVVANCKIPELEGISTRLDVDRFHLYHQGLELPTSVLPSFDVDVRTMRAAASDHLPHSAPRMAHTSIRLDEDVVAVATSAFNEDPVYTASGRLNGRFAYFTDLFLAPLILPSLGLPVVQRHVAATPVEDETLIEHVRRVSYNTVQETRRTSRGWVTRTVHGDDPLNRYWRPTRHNPMRAGNDQLHALRQVIGDYAAASPHTAFTTLLSGGIDSGAVTFLAAELGLPVVACSVGSPWGNEFEGARQLAGLAGVELVEAELSEDAFVRAIPDTVRWLGGIAPEVVEVALTATAVHRDDVLPPERALLTGYGSDLINAGLYSPYDSDKELITQVLEAVHRTRFTEELNSRSALAHGRPVFHPFWEWPVMKVALETAPGCKVREGREKFHLRTAFNASVPYEVAWRQKIAVHHGGGLQSGVARRLAADTGHDDRRRVYHHCFALLLERAADGHLDDWESEDVYERAAHAAKATL